VRLYAFDILTLEGDDLRKLPLHLRKLTLPACWPAAPTASI
jgi:bifunctional non-homologous end joining protein LigD